MAPKALLQTYVIFRDVADSLTQFVECNFMCYNKNITTYSFSLGIEQCVEPFKKSTACRPVEQTGPCSGEGTCVVVKRGEREKGDFVLRVCIGRHEYEK